MSTYSLRLIPTEFEYIPPIKAQEEARITLEKYFKTDLISMINYDEVEFIDQGSNWEEVLCPACKSTIDEKCWGDAMERAYDQSHFSDLSVTLPCCGTSCSLNELQYRWPAGFARFELQVREPNAEITGELIGILQQILQCKLRIIWAHY